MWRMPNSKLQVVAHCVYCARGTLWRHRIGVRSCRGSGAWRLWQQRCGGIPETPKCNARPVERCGLSPLTTLRARAGCSMLAAWAYAWRRSPIAATTRPRARPRAVHWRLCSAPRRWAPARTTQQRRMWRRWSRGGCGRSAKPGCASVRSSSSHRLQQLPGGTNLLVLAAAAMSTAAPIVTVRRVALSPVAVAVLAGPAALAVTERRSNLCSALRLFFSKTTAFGIGRFAWWSP
mmetsp:Transcript_56631/g.143412  ORF Transcript_56631/g.143412 Transcript_56631/m.143412 type:complete len:234 (-) Transcript_56631:665-1366(-)